MKFKLTEFNTHRFMKGAEAAKYTVTDEKGNSEWLWMSPKNIRLSIREFGAHPELMCGLGCYRQSKLVKAIQAQKAEARFHFRSILPTPLY